MTFSARHLQWDERTSANRACLGDNESMFRQLFERSADAIFLFDPGREVFVDCNQAAVEMMRATSKQQLLLVHPANLSSEFQPDGQSSHQKTTEVISLALSKGSHRFEWSARRMDGTEFPLEVLLTPIQTGEHPLMATVCRDITARKDGEAALRESEQKFRELFEASSDAIQILDPQERRIVDCNAATIRMRGGGDKEWFLKQPIESLSPERQPDGRPSREVGREWAQRALTQGPQRFEWIGYRNNGEEFPVEILLTAVCLGGRKMLVSVSRDISQRKKNERELRELNQSLERRVAERTAALATSEAQFRALVEHAPEAIVVFNGDTGRFLFGNEHACRLYGVPMEKLAELTPADVSPEFQPGGRRSSELAREIMDDALAGGMPVFEWLHQQQLSGRLISTEVRLLRLPAEGQNLIRASIIDNTDRKNAERALRESEAKFRALFEGSSQGVVLQDENQILEVNPAAVRIMGRQNPRELLGRHPGEFSPPLQPNGESSGVLARKNIQECMTNGSARFDWLACAPDGREISMEVMLTRIEWSGREVIQAFITDITERKRAQAALAESEAKFSVAFQACPFFIGILRMSDGAYVLANDAFVNWLGYSREELIGRSSAEFGMWENVDERNSALNDMRNVGSIRQREVRWRNRHGECLTILLSAETIKLNDTPHILSFAQDITQRKRAEEELRAGETRLRESEARFSAAFNFSPIMTGISRASDGRFVLVNDAALNWIGSRRDQVLGRTSVELGLWESPDDRERFWQSVNSSGSIRQWECRLRNRGGDVATMLASGVKIELNGGAHLLVMMVDISERKKAEAELQASEARLRESEARFSAAFQASPALIGILRMSDGKYVLANDAHLNWLGYTHEEVVGRSCLELGMWENPSERELVLKDMHAFGAIRQRECRWLNRRRERFTILLSADTIQLNNTPHMLLIALDITQRKRAEEEVLKTLEREKELSQLKSNFVSMVSHEFRTPLGIIQSSAELLRDFQGRMPVSERDEQLESISRNVRRMAGMMEEVLVLSRLDAGKLIFEPALLDLNLYCRRVVDEVLSATNRRCLIQLSLNAVPPEAGADERLLGHILTNLLTNAVKYSEPGATVHFAVERDGPDAVCVIRDSGIGISDEDQQQLFKAFHRGANVGTRPGTGLGLLLVKRCADLHGGKVQVNSRIGQGTTVTVRIPVFGTHHEKNTGH